MGALYCLAITIPTIILFSIIGAFYVNTTDAGNGVLFSTLDSLQGTPIYSVVSAVPDLVSPDGAIYYKYGTGVGQLYTFCDMVSNWSALFIFLFITLALIGGLRNRKTNQVKVNKFKFFIPMSLIAAICISIPIVVTIVEPFVNLIFLAKIPTSTPGYVDSILVPRIMALVMLLFYLALATLPTIIEDKIGIKKYGSIAKYEEEKINQIDIIMHKPLGSTSDTDADQNN